MEQQRGETENTDLIDVSDVEPNFDDFETDRGRAEGAERMPGMVSPLPESSGPAIASLKDRCAAFAVDAFFLYALYWIMMVLFRAIAVGAAAGPIPIAGATGLAFHGLFLFIALVWFVVPEAAFAASPGKLLCHLTIRRVDGAHATFLGVLVRNLMKPIDLLLFPLFVTAALLEWNNWHQRLGDLAGRTIVLRKLGSPPRQYALSLDVVATACGRAVAFAVDLALFSAFAGGLALALSPETPLASMLLVVLFPLAAVLFWLLPEWLTQGSPGKWVMGYALCLEDGSAIDLPSALMRTLWRPFDTTPWGFFTCLFSLRRQRPGDVAAGSVVISAPREWRGLAGLAVVVCVSLAALYGGLQNRDSFLHEDFQVNFLPSIDVRGGGEVRDTGPTNLITMNFRFAAGDATSVRKPSIFQPGETLFIVFETSGYAREEGRVWLQEDLSVRYPDDSVGLKLENINDFNQQLAQDGPIRFENNIAIPEGAQAGRYTVTITLRDKLSRQELKEQRFFYVTPPEAKAGVAPVPEDAGALPPPPVSPSGTPTPEVQAAPEIKSPTVNPSPTGGEAPAPDEGETLSPGGAAPAQPLAPSAKKPSEIEQVQIP